METLLIWLNWLFWPYQPTSHFQDWWVQMTQENFSPFLCLCYQVWARSLTVVPPDQWNDFIISQGAGFLLQKTAEEAFQISYRFIYLPDLRMGFLYIQRSQSTFWRTISGAGYRCGHKQLKKAFFLNAHKWGGLCAGFKKLPQLLRFHAGHSL